MEYGTLITAAGRAVEVMTNGASGSTVCRYRRRGRIRTGIRKYGEKSALQPGHQCPHGSNRGEGSTHGAVTIVPASRRDSAADRTSSCCCSIYGNWWELKSTPGDIGRSFLLVEKRENQANTAGGNKSRQAGAQRRTTGRIWVVSELAAISLRDMKTSDSAKTRADKAK